MSNVTISHSLTVAFLLLMPAVEAFRLPGKNKIVVGKAFRPLGKPFLVVGKLIRAVGKPFLPIGKPLRVVRKL